MLRYKPDPNLDYRDFEVRWFVERSRRMKPGPGSTRFQQISELTRELFGDRRMWSPKKVHMYLYYTRRSGPYSVQWKGITKSSKIANEGRVRQFIERSACFKGPSQIHREALKRFGPARVPSRASISRWITALRRRNNLPYF